MPPLIRKQTASEKKPSRRSQVIQKPERFQKARTVGKRLFKNLEDDVSANSELEANQNNMLMKPMKSNFEGFIRQELQELNGGKPVPELERMITNSFKFGRQEYLGDEELDGVDDFRIEDDEIDQILSTPMLKGKVVRKSQTIETKMDSNGKPAQEVITKEFCGVYDDEEELQPLKSQKTVIDPDGKQTVTQWKASAIENAAEDEDTGSDGDQPEQAVSLYQRVVNAMKLPF